MIVQDRKEAGRKLASKIQQNDLSIDCVYAVTSGGAVVGREMAEQLESEIQLIAVENMTAPSEPDKIIGAVTHDGTLTLKDSLLRKTNISSEYISQARISLMREALKFYRLYSGKSDESVSGKTVAVVDDGSMDYSGIIASVGHLKKRGAGKVFVVSPFLGAEAFEKIEGIADAVLVLEKRATDVPLAEIYRSLEWVSEKDLKHCVSSKNSSSV